MMESVTKPTTFAGRLLGGHMQLRRKWSKPFLLWLLLLGCSGAGPCGYHRLDARGAFPPEIKTLAVQPFTNQTLRYRIEQRFTQAVIEEILRRRLPVVLTNKPDQSDAVLSGDILAVTSGQALVDNRGTVRLFQIAIRSRITLRDQTRNRVLFDQPNLEFRGEYEFSSDPRSFFNEEDPGRRAPRPRLCTQRCHATAGTVLNTS